MTGAAPKPKRDKWKKTATKVVEVEMQAGKAGGSEGQFKLASRSKMADHEKLNSDEMMEESMDVKMLELLQDRVCKGTNLIEQIRWIVSLSHRRETRCQTIEVTLYLIAYMFDGIPATLLLMRGDWGRSSIKNTMAVIKLAHANVPAVRFSNEADAMVEDPNIILKGGVFGGELLAPTGKSVQGTSIEAFRG